MQISNLKDLFVEHLKDLYSSEQQVQDAYSRWKDAATSDDLKQMFDRHLEQSDSRRSNIERICDDIGVEPTGEKCEGTEGMIREGDKVLEESTEGPIRDATLIAAAQRIEHYSIAGYGCARTYALQLDFDDTAETLQESLDSAADLDERMTDLAERVLNPEAAAA